MTLDAKVLNKLSEWQPAYGRRQLTLADEGGWTINFTVDRRDELSCLLWEISFSHKQASAAETLHTCAERLAKTLSAVLEPIRVLEVDEQRNEAILRSTETRVLGESALHYDVLTTGIKAAVLRRYKSPANKTGKREQTAFALTTEGLVRLISAVVNDK